MALDAAGNLYGTTVNGGSGGCDGEGCGTVFKVTPGGSHTVLYAFTGGADGSGPYFAILVLDRAGDLFGTTVAGGRNTRCNNHNGCGTIFELAADGAESVLHLFSGARGGAEPADGVINDDKGNLYGITWNGGVAKGGTIFELGR